MLTTCNKTIFLTNFMSSSLSIIRSFVSKKNNNCAYFIKEEDIKFVSILKAYNETIFRLKNFSVLKIKVCDLSRII